jgi:fibronectin-binding autotransporter adhesin
MSSRDALRGSPISTIQNDPNEKFAPPPRCSCAREVALIGLLGIAVSASAQTTLNWANVGTDFTTGADWGGTAPANDLVTHIANFGTASPTQQPNLATSQSVAGVAFGSGAGSFTLSGSGTLSLGASGLVNAATANTQSVSLPLALGASASFSNSGLTGNLTIAGSVDTGGFGLKLEGGAGAGIAQVSGAINGSGSVTKTGTGTWQLAGPSTYSGGTTITNGFLYVTSSGALPAGGSVNLNATTAGTTATLQLGDSLTQTIGNVTFGGTGATSTSTSNITIGSGSTLTLGGGNVTYNATNNPRATTISGGTLALGANTTFTIADTTTTATEITVTSVVSGTGFSLIKDGPGRLLLTNANTYDGGTIVNSGTLSIQNTTGSGVGTGAVTINAGGQLRGTGFIGGFTTVNSGGLLEPAAPPTVLTFTNGLTLNGGSILALQLGSTSDLIRLSGGALSGPASGLITLSIFNSGGFAAGVTYDVFDFAGATSVSNFTTGSFAFGTLPGSTVASDFSIGVTGSVLNVTYNGSPSAIPEPSAYAALFGTSALVGAGWRRRRLAKLADIQN